MWNPQKLKECKKTFYKKHVEKMLEVEALLWTFGISGIAKLLRR